MAQNKYRAHKYRLRQLYMKLTEMKLMPPPPQRPPQPDFAICACQTGVLEVVTSQPFILMLVHTVEMKSVVLYKQV